jgi:hypothetical protein
LSFRLFLVAVNDELGGDKGLDNIREIMEEQQCTMCCMCVAVSAT